MFQRRKASLSVAVGIALASLVAVAEALAAEADVKAPAATATSTPAADHGIQVMSVRTSANGNMIDFRYKVLDSDKAATLMNREHKPFLIDEATGAKLRVPSAPKIGPLRQTAQKPAVGRVYFTLFANPGKMVKPGSKVTLVVGDTRLEHLSIE